MCVSAPKPSKTFVTLSDPKLLYIMGPLNGSTSIETHLFERRYQLANQKKVLLS